MSKSLWPRLDSNNQYVHRSYHEMREINKLTTVDVMHFDHGNDMHTHSDNGNDMHTHSEHGNEMQPIVNMCTDILCDENGSDTDSM